MAGALHQDGIVKCSEHSAATYSPEDHGSGWLRFEFRVVHCTGYVTMLDACLLAGAAVAAGHPDTPAL